MNKGELIDKIVASSKPGDIASKAAATRLVEMVFDTIAEEVVSGNDVLLVGFGTFKAVKRAERTSRNPQTGETIKIPATVVPKFKPGKAFKDAVAKK